MTDVHEIGPLLARVQAGDRDALNLLLERLRPYLHQLVRFRLGAEGPQNSSFVQETHLRMHRALDPNSPNSARFRGSTPPQFLAWCGQITRNVIADEHRRRRPGTPGSKTFKAIPIENEAELDSDRAEVALQVAAAVERLPPEKRQLIQWRFFDQLTYKEISERTGRSEPALRVMLTRTLKSLRSDGVLDGLVKTDA